MKINENKTHPVRLRLRTDIYFRVDRSTPWWRLLAARGGVKVKVIRLVRSAGGDAWRAGGR